MYILLHITQNADVPSIPALLALLTGHQKRSHKTSGELGATPVVDVADKAGSLSSAVACNLPVIPSS